MLYKRVLVAALVCLSSVLFMKAKAWRRSHDWRHLDTKPLDAARSAFTGLAKEKGKKTNDKLNRAISEIEKAMASMDSNRRKYRFDDDAVKSFTDTAERAAKAGNVVGFRRALGRALYMNTTARARKIAESYILMDGAKEFLKDIRKKIGDDNFNELISADGEVTLVFVIDTTGSMKDDIEAATAIAKQIVNYGREMPVNFILSRFNDPDVKPIIYRGESDLYRAVKDLQDVTVQGGQDCPEKTFEGILQALYFGPLPASTMYVFSDASAKDATDDNIDTVKAIAIDLGVPINFFSTGNCGDESNRDSFRTVAESTGGHVFPLHNPKQIMELSKFVRDNLGGSAAVDARKTNVTKESKDQNVTHLIPIDDTVGKAIVTVTITVPQNITLLSPDGWSVPVRDDIELNKIFEVNNPQPGEWKLVVPRQAGDHEYFVKTIDKVNVDFSHYYFKYLPRNNKAHVPVNHPLLGEDAMVMVSIPEVHQLKINSLNLRVEYKNGTDGGLFKLHKLAHSRIRFVSTLKVHRGPYRLQLVGNTNNGYMFTRLSPTYDVAKPFRLQVVYAREYNLPLGKTSTLILKIENRSKEKNFTYTVFDTFGYVHLTKETIRKRGAITSIIFDLDFTVPATDKENVDKTNKVVIKATSEKTKLTSTLVLYLLVTDN